MSMRLKSAAVLKANIRELPRQIGIWRHNGKTEQADRAQRIFDASKAELDRRGSVKLT